MLFGNAMERALLKVGLINHKRKSRIPKIRTFPCYKCQGTLETIPYTNVAACQNEKCNNRIIFN